MALGILPVSAAAQDFGSFVSPGELADAHAEVRGVTNCVACHEVGVGVSATRCMKCHDAVRNQVSNKTGFHKDKGETCQSCHPDHRGRTFQMVKLSKDDFDHDQTGFPLEGAHAKQECKDCHTKAGEWAGLKQTCVSCHEDPHGSMESDRPLLAGCETCHGVERWDALPIPTDVFDHTDAKQADFVLEGLHREVDCERCHTDMRFVPTASESCATCHQDMHRKQFGNRGCEQCHTVNVRKWQRRDYPHDSTKFPLEGQHRKVSCEACHGDKSKARYVDLPHERCDTCHSDPHKGQFKPRDCDACHSIAVAGFKLANFDHDTTKFPLKGAHAQVLCETCHGTDAEKGFAGLVFDDCSSCHQDPHEGDFAPDLCSTCHQETSWEVADFDHNRTAYPLEGGHLEVACVSCHGEGDARQLKGVDHSTCAACHGVDEPHAAHFEPARCDSCHQVAAWALVAFDHAAETGFRIAGKHEGLDCVACHGELSFPEVEPACSACHQDDAPAEHFPGECGACHVETGWAFASLGANGHDVTGFPLRGAHQAVACQDCHAPGVKRAAAQATCSSCHAAEDPHRHMLGDRCESCHTTLDWMRTTFRHTTTGFPLRGVHRAILCEECHAGGFGGTPRECGACHSNARPRTPVHDIPQSFQCDACHRPYDWDQVSYPH